MLLFKKIKSVLNIIYHNILKRSGKPERQKSFPYEVLIKEFIPHGCKFEVSTHTEYHRIEKFGDEKEFIKQILNEVRPSTVFFDIGACVGLVSIHAAAKGATIIAFEPDPSYRKRLLNNLKLNNLHNVQLIEWAVSDEQGETYLFTEEDANGRSPSLRNDGNRNAVKVLTNSIDNAIAHNDIPRPDILKIDIEGAEILALRGMKKLLSSNPPPIIFIESHPTFLPLFNSSAEEVDKLIQSYGYRVAYKDDRSETRSVKCIHYIYRRI